MLVKGATGRLMVCGLYMDSIQTWLSLYLQISHNVGYNDKSSIPLSCHKPLSNFEFDTQFCRLSLGINEPAEYWMVQKINHHLDKYHDFLYLICLSMYFMKMTYSKYTSDDFYD